MSTRDAVRDPAEADRSSESAAPDRSPRWLPLVAGPACWGVHLWAGYVLVSDLCASTAGSARATWSQISVPLAVSLTLGALVLWAGTVSFRNWRRAGGGLEPPAGTPAEARAWWMSLLGLMLNAIFLMGIGMSVLSLLWLRPCG